MNELARELLVQAEAEGRAGDPSTLELLQQAREADPEDAEVQMWVHVLTAQTLGAGGQPGDRRHLEMVVEHARAASAAAEQLKAPPPLFATICGVLGTSLFGLADKLPPDQAAKTLDEATAALRRAYNLSAGDDPKRLERASNLSAILEQHRPGQTVQEYRERLIEAAQLADEIELRDPNDPARATVFAQNAGHVSQKLAHVHRLSGDFDAAQAAYRAAQVRYETALGLSVQLGLDPTPVQLGLAQLLADQAVHSGGLDLLDAAIDEAERALAAIPSDDRRWLDAGLQLSRHYVARYTLNRQTADAARADELSWEASAEILYEPGSAELSRARQHRVEVLAAIALGKIGTYEHVVELDELLTELHGATSTPQLDVIRAMADAARTIRRGWTDDPGSWYEELVRHAEAFDDAVSNHPDGATDPVLWVRAHSMHATAAEVAVLVGVDPRVWVPRLDAAADHLRRRFEPGGPRSPLWSFSRAQLARDSLSTGMALQDRTRLWLSTRYTLEVRESAEQLDPDRRMALAADAVLACDLIGRTDLIADWVAWGMEATQALEKVTSGPAVVRIAFDRDRHEFAGTAAAHAGDRRELAWRLHHVVHGASTPSDRGEFLEVIEAASRELTPVFVAQSPTRCVAAVVSNGVWKSVELPALTRHQTAGVIARAHREHARMSQGQPVASGDWAQARADLEKAITAGLTPLVSALTGSTTPVSLRLSGWLHATPLASALMAALGYCRPVVVALGRGDQRDDVAPTARRRVAALAAPGDWSDGSYLRAPDQDVNEILAMFPGTAPAPDGSRESAREALANAELVVIAAHGRADPDPSASRILLDDGPLTVAEIEQMDLQGLRLAVLAACEANSIDFIVPSHPHSVVAAVVSAGADAAVGPLWQIHDDVASKYTTTVMARLAAGADLAEAHATAVQAAGRVRNPIVDVTMIVANELTLIDQP